MSPDNDFVSPETSKYRFKIGRHIASSLSGFIAGVIAASIVWFAVAYLTDVLR
jgi:hypothetical protein